MMAEDSYCSCSTTAPDDSCSCDRSDVHRLEVVIRQPSQPSDCGDRLQSSKRSQREHKSTAAVAGKTNDEVRQEQFTSSTEALHRSPADDEYNCDGRPPTREQRSHSCESTAVGPEVPNLLRATDPQALPDISTTELQVAAGQQLQRSNFCATDDPRAAQFYTNDFCAVIMPNASDDFDAVDLTVDDYRPRSFDIDSWGDRGFTIDSVQARSLESGTWGVGVQQMARDVRKEKVSLWMRIKKYISNRLCCQRQ